MTERQERTLRAYEVYIPRGSRALERLFIITLTASVCVFIGLGLWFRTVKPAPLRTVRRIVVNSSQLLLQEKRKPDPPPKPKKAPKPKPIDLTKKPELNKKNNEIINKPRPRKRIRRVYGVRKVYSKGLGAGGSLADAVIGKLGNTLKKEVDTLKATEEELKGPLVSVTKVTTMPRLKKVVKPVYTDEMRDNGIEGAVKAKIQVDIDGRVKKIIILSDLGYGTADAARAALLQCEFAPAMEGKEPVATWILFTIRFELLAG